MIFKKTSSTIRLALGATALTLIGSVAQADFVISDDLIVDGSACIGFDCVNGENFGFDTLRLKENNLRIHFEDTSNSASFPTADWRIVANDTSNGGANYLAFEDTLAGRQTFRVFQGAPLNAMVVDAQGDLGLGTATPVVELHIVDGDTPTVRLEQNGSSGFTPQTWDMAGNETNWFVRDVTSGSDLVLRLRAGAPANSIFVDTDGDVGFGTATPDDGGSLAERLVEIKDSNDVRLSLDSGDGSGKFGELLFQRANADVFGVGADNSNFYIFGYDAGVNQNVMTIDRTTGAITFDGNVTINGSLTCSPAPC